MRRLLFGVEYSILGGILSYVWGRLNLLLAEWGRDNPLLGEDVIWDLFYYTGWFKIYAAPVYTAVLLGITIYVCLKHR